MSTSRFIALLGIGLLSTCAILDPVRADEQDPEPNRGFGYVGAFYVTRVDTRLNVFTTGDLPLGARLDLDDDLGVSQSLTAPRGEVGWTFGRHHLLAGSYYRIRPEGSRVLERTIQLPPDLEFEVGVDVETSFESEIFKLEYTWLFHRDAKVDLGIGAGLFVTSLSAEISASGFFGAPVESKAFAESVTAPLPVIGGRLGYRVTKKLSLTATADLFFLDYQGYKGQLSDVQVYLVHHTFKHLGFVFGLNAQAINVDIDDGALYWQIDEGLTGFLLGVGFYF